MTTLQDRPGTAVVVIDVQNDVVGGAYRRDEVVANILTVLGKARAQGVPVVWVRHHDDELVVGSDGWQIVPELVPEDGEPIVEKAYGDAFEDTTMESVLAGLGVGRLVVTGVLKRLTDLRRQIDVADHNLELHGRLLTREDETFRCLKADAH